MVFFFQANCAHRDLHPFPTRRSSDLLAAVPGLRRLRDRLRLEEVAAGDTREFGELARSEEHTSELQSLRHLVCRLLLEKKKPPKPGTTKYCDRSSRPSDSRHTASGAC